MSRGDSLRQGVHVLRILVRELRGTKLEPEVPFMDRFVRPDAQCLHIGASDGRHSLHLARRVPAGRVHCIEASPYTLGVLKCLRWLLGVRNLAFHNLAIGAADGTTTLVTPIKRSGRRGRAFAHIGASPVTQANAGPDADFVGFETQPVAVRTLDSFCAEQDIRRIDFLRCDIEGAEILMLEGGQATIARHRPVMMIEVHPAFLRERFGRSAGEVWRRLTDLDYRMFHLHEGALAEATRFFDEPWRDYFCVPGGRLHEFGLAPPDGETR